MSPNTEVSLPMLSKRKKKPKLMFYSISMHHEMNNLCEISTQITLDQYGDFFCFSHTLPKMHSEHNVVPLRTVYLTVTKCLLGTD